MKRKLPEDWVRLGVAILAVRAAIRAKVEPPLVRALDAILRAIRWIERRKP